MKRRAQTENASGPDHKERSDRERSDRQAEERRPRRRRRFRFWMGLGLLAVAALFFLAWLSLTGRSLNAPQWVADQLEARINAGVPSGRVSLGRLQVRVDPNGVPHIALGNVGIYDQRGAEIARLNTVQARFSLAAMLRGKVQPETARLTGAQMVLRRRLDGLFDVSFGTGAITSGTLPGMLDGMDRAFAQQALGRLKHLEANDLTITLEDVRSGRRWQITDGTLNIRRKSGDVGAGLDISVTFDVFNGTEDLAHVIIGVRTVAKSSAASIGISFQNLAASDLAAQSPVLSFLSVLNAPISGAVRADFDAAGALGTFAGTLDFGQGALQPRPEIEPVPFSEAKAYFEFDAAAQKLTFSEVRVRSQTASVTARGHAYLRDYEGAWPSTFLGQFVLSDIRVHPTSLYEKPLGFSRGIADFRVRLKPFSIDVGQFILQNGEEKLAVKAAVLANEKGWSVDADAKLNRITMKRLLELWPVSAIPKTRAWIETNVRRAELSGVNGAFRLRPQEKPHYAVDWNFSKTDLRYLRSQPDMENASGYGSVDGKVFTMFVEKAEVKAPMGGTVQVVRSTFQVPDIHVRGADAKVHLNVAAAAPAVLSLLDLPPLRVLKNTSFGPDLAQGDARILADINFRLIKNLPKDAVRFSATGTLERASSDILVPGRHIAAQRLEMRANNDLIEISGPVKLDAVKADVTWHQDIGPNAQGKGGIVSGTVALGPAFVGAFAPGLPKGSVVGEGRGRFRLELPARGAADRAPRFTLVSDLNRIGLRIAPVGWSKPRAGTGELKVAGRLGKTPAIDSMELRAAGLRAEGGAVSLRPDGTMDKATFRRVRIGGWLDAPLVIEGRGKGAVPLVRLNGGVLDIRKTSFGGASGARRTAGGPLSVKLDKVIISEGMSLTAFSGNFDTTGGFAGTFVARMNGATPLKGELSPSRNGTSIHITSRNGGGVLRDAGILKIANNGQMDLRLTPQASPGSYTGNLLIRKMKVVNAPGLTELLSAISVVGLLDQLSGEGISFETLNAKFRITPAAVYLENSSAVGPSLGISLDGIYDLNASQMDMQGVISPVFFLNGIGQAVSRKGEGLFGFTFKLRGPADDPRVSVNPLSILTPGILRDIFRARRNAGGN